MLLPGISYNILVADAAVARLLGPIVKINWLTMGMRATGVGEQHR